MGILRTFTDAFTTLTKAAGDVDRGRLEDAAEAATYTGPAPETVGAEWFTAEQVAVAYAYGRRDEHFHPVQGACLSEVFAAFARGADVSDFQRIYNQLAAQGGVA